MGPAWRCVCCCVWLAVLLQLAAAQFGGMPGMGMPEKPKAQAVKSDVQYIRCQACEALVKQAYRHTKSAREALKPGHKLSESDIIEALEKMCDPAQPEGQWISHYDIVEQGDELKLLDKKQPSRCDVECMTLARACSEVSEALDLSDLSELLFNGAKRAALSSMACHDTTDVCRRKPPPVPKDRKPGPPFTPLSAEEAERDRLMASMKAAGLGGQMYSREDIMNQMGSMQGAMSGGDDDADSSGSGSSGSGGQAAAAGEGLQAKVAKAAESVQEVVGQAAEAAAAVVDKAGSLLRDSISKLGGGLVGGKGAGEAEL